VCSLFPHASAVIIRSRAQGLLGDPGHAAFPRLQPTERAHQLRHRLRLALPNPQRGRTPMFDPAKTRQHFAIVC